MYRLLIVDDEPEIVNWLYVKFSEQRQLDLELYKAYSAKDAVAWLNKAKIDIVLSDIRMPGMTGLQLFEHIKSSWPKCRVIFLTGYREFDYVYTAIQSSGVRYLLKTEKDERIIGAVEECIKEIEDSRINQDFISKAREQMDRVLPLLQREYLLDLLDSGTNLDEEARCCFDELKIPLYIDMPVFLFAGRFDNLSQSMTALKSSQQFYMLKTISDQNMPTKCNSICFMDEKRNFIWLLQPDRYLWEAAGCPESGEFWAVYHIRIKAAAEDIQQACKKVLGHTVSFVINSSPLPFSALPEKYRVVEQLIGYRIGIGKEWIISEKSIFNSEKESSVHEDKAFQAAYKQVNKLAILEYLIEEGQKDAFMKQLSHAVECLRYVKSRNYNPALEIYYSISTLFLRYINRWNLTEKIAFRLGLHKLTRADEHVSWDDAVEYLYKLAGLIFDAKAADEETRATDVIHCVQQYINEHLNEELSLTRLSDLVYMNPSYLSRLFKQHTGMNFLDYINSMRVKKARELLKGSTKKISEISLEVGYESQQSFTRFFKNIEGMTPQEYRSSFDK